MVSLIGETNKVGGEGRPCEMYTRYNRCGLEDFLDASCSSTSSALDLEQVQAALCFNYNFHTLLPNMG